MARERRERRGRKKGGGCFGFLLKLMLFGFLMSLVVGLFAFAALYRFVDELSVGLPDVRHLDHYEPAETTRIYASDGTLIATLFQENRTWVPLKDMSPYVTRALLSIEDTRFYEHNGVDYRGVLRAIYVDLTHKGRREGASTITMQLARNLFLNNQPNMRRKIQEAILAQRIEKQYSKDKILELYLNQVYFGAGAYGIGAAASLYCGKKASQLSPAEAALIVGLLQAPSAYCPLVDPDAARTRAKVVLARMKEVEALSRGEYGRAVTEVDHLKFGKQEEKQAQLLKYPYFTTYVIQELAQRYPEEVLYRSGLKIQTTLDIPAQRRAEQILHDQVNAAAYDLNVDSGALVLVENKTGFIRAMVGGTGYTPSNQFNRAWQALRQPGSSFKVIVYACALENGFTPDTMVSDTAVTYQAGGMNWTPKNSDGSYMGEIPLRTALQYSRNVVAVKLLAQLGTEQVIAQAYRMGIKQELKPALSMALGSTEVTPLEMAQVYSCLANGGVRRKLSAVKLIQDSHGNVVEDLRTPRDERVLSDTTAASMVDMMTTVVTAGTGTRAQVPGHPIAGKTGTTDSFRDAWFCGFSPQYTLTVWVGNNDNSPMWRSYGGDLPATIFREVMKSVLAGASPGSFPRPRVARNPAQPQMIRVRICKQSHKLALEACPDIEEKTMKPADAPRDTCDVHGMDASMLAPPEEDLPQPEETPDPGAPAPDPGETPLDQDWVDDTPRANLPTGQAAPVNVIPEPDPLPTSTPATPQATPTSVDQGSF